jgi:hypothetical protein
VQELAQRREALPPERVRIVGGGRASDGEGVDGGEHGEQLHQGAGALRREVARGRPRQPAEVLDQLVDEGIDGAVGHRLVLVTATVQHQRAMLLARAAHEVAGQRALAHPRRAAQVRHHRPPLLAAPAQRCLEGLELGAAANHAHVSWRATAGGAATGNPEQTAELIAVGPNRRASRAISRRTARRDRQDRRRRRGAARAWPPGSA